METMSLLALTMQKCPPAVCGVLVLLKKSLNSLVLKETGAAQERLLFLRLEQRPVWAQQDLKHNQDLFTRCVCKRKRIKRRERRMEFIFLFYCLTFKGGFISCLL